MQLLLDTHALIWWVADDPALTITAREAITQTENDVFVSAASAMEIATKYRLGKLPEAALLALSFESIVAAEGFSPLDISIRHAVVAGSLRVTHKDPFDRLLVAQALTEQLTLVSNERLFDGFGIARLW